MYSCVDERSAAYMACGIAAESGEPIVVTCTEATASRNYLPWANRGLLSQITYIGYYDRTW
ncbi:hypothetical protein NXW30_12495 [Phocaeicola vulgatus]|nr:hypothetical protein [Phocaeicola vulgatus]